MAARSMRIKVRTADLIAKVESAKAKAVADHAKALSAFDVNQAKRRTKTVEALRAALAAVEDGGELPAVGDRHIRGAYRTVVYVPAPGVKDGVKPTLNVRDFDKDIELLKLASDDTLAISTDDRFARYL